MAAIDVCICCPTLSTRSRHPIKRYKTLLSDIFPRSQGEEPNDRKINKLCEYASRNPLRIPKITSYLEQRCFKELRNERFHHVRVVMCIYGKLLILCPEQMPLYASSFLSIVHILLEQTRHDEMQVLGCQALFDFVSNQKDGTYMFSLDGMILKLCEISQEMGDDERAQILHAAGLQALSSMVWFMGEYSHISTKLDDVVSVVLENYGGHGKDTDSIGNNGSTLLGAIMRIPSWREMVNVKGEANVPLEGLKNPTFWSKVCLNNMAKLAKEATTVRRVLEALFRYFDNNELWSLECGLALSVLQDMQVMIENSGHNTHFLLSTLIKHLDHKNILKKPSMQLDIVNISASLAKQTKVEASVAIIGAIGDMIRHLRKSIHCSLDDSDLGVEVIEWNRTYKAAVDNCLVELCQKVGDASPILDIMALMLDNMTDIAVMSRTLISAVYRTAQIVASLAYSSCKKKAFPEALFHQLLLAMTCSDHETRVGAHRIFSVVLVPSSICPNPRTAQTSRNPIEIQRTLSRTVSVFSPSAALFRKLAKEQTSRETTTQQENEDINNNSILNRLKSSYSRAYSVKGHGAEVNANDKIVDLDGEQLAESLRLSSHQINLLLSSIWAQCLSPTNTPENYEAIAHTYSLILLFARTKNSGYEVLIRGFQLSFSLRDISLVKGKLQPSRRRSLFTLATAMIIFLSKAFNIPPLFYVAKAVLTDKTVDPFLKLVEDDCKLQAVVAGPDQPSNVYGSQQDTEDAAKALSEINLSDSQSRESSAALIVRIIARSSEESSTIKRKLLSDFLSDDFCNLGAQMYKEASRQIQKSYSKGNEGSMGECSILTVEDDDDISPDTCQSQQDCDLKFARINEFLDSIVETTDQVEKSAGLTTLGLSYKEIAGNCEALLHGKQQKMSSFMDFQRELENLTSFPDETRASSYLPVGLGFPSSGNPFLDQSSITSPYPMHGSGPMPCAAEYHHFALPASNPYDNFRKAAGC